MATLIAALNPIHDLTSFDCRNNELNTFLKTTAGQHQTKFISKTYVLVDEESPALVIGFYTLAVRRTVPIRDLPAVIAKRLPREVPGFSLARLAIHVSEKKKGHGEYLLLHATQRTARVADEIGGYALFVDAKDEIAAAFYQQYGFVPFPDNPLILFMPFKNMPQWDSVDAHRKLTSWTPWENYLPAQIAASTNFCRYTVHSYSNRPQAATGMGALSDCAPG